MYLRDLAKIIYVPGTASEYLNYTVALWNEKDRLLWSGHAKDLENQNCLHNWLVVEVRVDPTTNNERKSIPDYNFGKIIYVI